MKVYVVYEFMPVYEITNIYKVFLNKEKAEAFVDDKSKHSSEDYAVYEFEVEE